MPPPPWDIFRNTLDKCVFSSGEKWGIKWSPDFSESCFPYRNSLHPEGLLNWFTVYKGKKELLDCLWDIKTCSFSFIDPKLVFERSTACVWFKPIIQRIICLINPYLPLTSAILIPPRYRTETGIEFFFFCTVTSRNNERYGLWASFFQIPFR